MQATHGMLGFLLGVMVCAGCPPLAHDEGAAVRSGLEVLLSDSLHLVRGKRVGLVTNQSGVDGAGVSGVDRLVGAGVHLVALFSPEHGFRGTADPGAEVASSRDSATGLPIYSLYGRNSAPTDTMLAGIDVLLVDLQDAGARYYTYLWTTVGVMRAAAARGLPVIVLDRPNPIGGAVQGNVLDTAYRSAVGLVAVPMRHGMTLGELAQLARHDLGLTTDLVVVPAAGWRRTMYFDETGLPFVPPSPNLRTLEALIHYPGLCLFEGTTLSVGRGTDRPFELVGAPWIEPRRFAAALDLAQVPGVKYVPLYFTPATSAHQGSACGGVSIVLMEPGKVDSVLLGLTLASVLNDLYPGVFKIDGMLGLLGNAEALKMLKAGRSPAEVLTSGDSDLRTFMAKRQRVLLYGPLPDPKEGNR